MLIASPMHSYIRFNSPSFFTSTAPLTTYQWPLLRAKATRGEAVACTLEPSEQAKRSSISSAHTFLNGYIINYYLFQYTCLEYLQVHFFL